MTFMDVITPGDKIDIHLVQQLGQENHGRIAARLYKSNVLDFLSNTLLEISMPMEGTKVILLDSGMRLELTFYTKRGLYQCQVLVQKRYKKDNLFILLVEQKTDLVKFQRREYFRIECSSQLRFYSLPEETAGLETTRELFEKIQEPEYQLNGSYGKMIDISGGGMRFLSSHALENRSYILAEFRLQNDRVDQTFYLVSQVVASEEKNGERGKFVNRAKFLYKDLKDREAIVRYVFEEERRIRRVESR